MKGFLAYNSVLVDRNTWLFTKAFVVPTRDKSERVEENFMVDGVGWYNTSQFFLSLCWVKGEIELYFSATTMLNLLQQYDNL